MVQLLVEIIVLFGLIKLFLNYLIEMKNKIESNEKTEI